jgi:hypothetical protein
VLLPRVKPGPFSYLARRRNSNELGWNGLGLFFDRSTKKIRRIRKQRPYWTGVVKAARAGT